MQRIPRSIWIPRATAWMMSLLCKGSQNYQSPVLEIHIFSLRFQNYWVLHWIFYCILHRNNAVKSSKGFSHPTILTTDTSWQLLLGSCHQFDNNRYELINLGKHALCLDISFASLQILSDTYSENKHLIPIYNGAKARANHQENRFQIARLAGCERTSSHTDIQCGNLCVQRQSLLNVTTLFTSTTDFGKVLDIKVHIWLCNHNYFSKPRESPLDPFLFKMIARNSSQLRWLGVR